MRPTVWWLFGVDKGEWYVKGPYATEQEARAEGTSLYDGEWDAYELNTSRRADATPQLKVKRQERYHLGMHDACQRVRHRYRERNNAEVRSRTHFLV